MIASGLTDLTWTGGGGGSEFQDSAKFIKIMLGKIFGLWTVTKKNDVETLRQGTLVLDCICSGCNKTYPVLSASLRNGKSKCCSSCTHKQKRLRTVKEMLGRKFEFWTVIKKNNIKTLQMGKLILDCVCSGCGKTYPVRSISLRYGGSKGCRSCTAKLRWEEGRGPY